MGKAGIGRRRAADLRRLGLRNRADHPPDLAAHASGKLGCPAGRDLGPATGGERPRLARPSYGPSRLGVSQVATLLPRVAGIVARHGANPRLPDLGPHGEGWVLGQLVLLGLVIVLGTRSGIPSLGNAGFMGWLSFVLGAGGLAIGAWLLLRGIVDLGRSLTPLPRPRADARLVESGIYATLRHPIYAGMIAASVGWGIFTRSPAALVVALLLAALLDGKARREEAWLLERYPPYAAYRLRTRRFLPGVY